MSFYYELVNLSLPGVVTQSGNPVLECSQTGRNDRPFQQNRNDQTKVDQQELLSLTAAKRPDYLLLLQLQPKFRIYNLQYTFAILFLYLNDKSISSSLTVKLFLTPSSIADDLGVHKVHGGQVNRDVEPGIHLVGRGYAHVHDVRVDQLHGDNGLGASNETCIIIDQDD